MRAHATMTAVADQRRPTSRAGAILDPWHTARADVRRGQGAQNPDPVGTTTGSTCQTCPGLFAVTTPSETATGSTAMASSVDGSRFGVRLTDIPRVRARSLDLRSPGRPLCSTVPLKYKSHMPASDTGNAAYSPVEDEAA